MGAQPATVTVSKLAACLVLLAVPASAAARTPPHQTPGERYRVSVLADRPVGYWEFGEARGARFAVPAAGGVRGVYHGSRPVPGVVGRARAFDGLGAFVSIASRPAWSQPTTGVLTVEFWMKQSRLVFPHEEGSGYVWILGKGEPGRQEWGFRIYGANDREQPSRAGRVAFYAYNPEGGEGAGAYFQDAPRVGKWIYVVGELTPTGVRIYRDGRLRQGPPAAATLYANPAYHVVARAGSAPIRIGTRNGGSFFAGAVDELAVYSHLLSAKQIRAHYAAGLRALGLRGRSP